MFSKSSSDENTKQKRIHENRRMPDLLPLYFKITDTQPPILQIDSMDIYPLHFVLWVFMHSTV